MPSRFEDLDPATYRLPAGLLERTLTPALVVHLDFARENIGRILAYTGGANRWRPHLKTTKIPRVWAELVRAGVRQFKCATTREARLLLALLRQEDIEAGDLLVAYPLRDPALAQLDAIAADFPESRVSILCEDPHIARHLPEHLSAFVDVNPGMNRTGIPASDRDAILAVAQATGSRFRGIHFYEGHLFAGDPAQRREEVFACHDLLWGLYSTFLGRGVPVPELITSGTPGFLAALAYPRYAELDRTIHRVSPGTVLFHDLRSEQENTDLELVPAATVLARVVSRPAADIVTCDAGSKSLAAEAGDPCAFVVGRPELVALGPSEEHLPLRVTSGARPELGEVLQLVPRHVCPTVNLAEEALLVSDGKHEIVPVAGRAHELSAF